MDEGKSQRKSIPAPPDPERHPILLLARWLKRLLRLRSRQDKAHVKNSTLEAEGCARR